jgi:hypothetical protein
MDPIQATLTSAIQQITSALILGLVLVATTLIGLAVQKGVQYLKVKLGDTQLGTLKEIAQTVVRSLEQNPIFKDLDPTAKKERASWPSRPGARRTTSPSPMNLWTP